MILTLFVGPTMLAQCGGGVLNVSNLCEKIYDRIGFAADVNA